MFYVCCAFFLQPVVRSLSEFCQSYLAMEKENKRLDADLAMTRSKFNSLLMSLLIASTI
jgi:hypothetical protein